MIDYFTEDQRLEMGHCGLWWDGEYVTAAELTVEDIARYHAGGRIGKASRNLKRLRRLMDGLSEADIRDAADDIIERSAA